MRVPNADTAVIAPEKLRDCLLDLSHRRGASKARLLLSMGYRQDTWQRMASDLRQQHLATDLATESDNEYGKRYEIIAPITTPCGRSVIFCSVWQIDRGTDIPPAPYNVPEVTAMALAAMALELFTDVVLTADLPGTDLRAGDVGTVVERHVVAGKEDGYSVEFFDMTGATVAVRTLRANQLRVPTGRDRPAGRPATAA